MREEATSPSRSLRIAIMRIERSLCPCESESADRSVVEEAAEVEGGGVLLFVFSGWRFSDARRRRSSSPRPALEQKLMYRSTILV